VRKKKRIGSLLREDDEEERIALVSVIGRGLRRASALICTFALLAACGATPVGVRRMDPRAVQRELTRSILTSDTLSTSTRNVLFRRDLVERWKSDPGGTMASLHEHVARGEARRDDVFALAAHRAPRGPDTARRRGSYAEP
jgi:hypothetical protein